MNVVYIIRSETEGATIIYVVIMYISRSELSPNIYPVNLFFELFFTYVVSS